MTIGTPFCNKYRILHPIPHMNIENTSRSRQEIRNRIRRVTVGAIAVNLSLSALKLAAGLFGRSQAMVADAVHSLSDTATDLAILMGVGFWSAPPDERHPYGHWRIESLVTTMIGLALVAVALGIGARSIRHIHAGTSDVPSAYALAAAVASMVIKELLYRWTLATGNELRSSAVIANAWHHRSDALSSIPAAAAILTARLRPGWAVVDPVGAIVVSVFVFRAAWGIMRGALGDLIDEGVPEAMRERIRAIAEATGGVSSVHAIRTRRVGPGYYLDLHVLVTATLSVKAGHDIAKSVKTQLMKLQPEILDVVVHIEPETRNPKPLSPSTDQPGTST